MNYHVSVTFPDTTKVSNDRDEATEALTDAENAIPSGYRPSDYDKIGQDVHVFRNDQAASNLERDGKLELNCPDGTIISITKM